LFDVYMHAHAVDPRARRRMQLLLGAAVVATSVSIGSAVMGQRLGIARVHAPKVEGILVMPIDVQPAPLQPPPSRKGEESATNTSDAPPDPQPPERADDDLAPLEKPTTRAQRGTPNGTDDGTNILGRPQVPGLPCVPPQTCPVVKPPVDPHPEPPDDPPPITSIEVARERAKHAPDPPEDRLARTPAGLSRRNVTARVAFCIDTNGHTAQVRSRGSGGDPEVDRICRETVAKWQFRPFLVDDKPRMTCTEATFHIDFD
jgi:TonB family protein